MDAGDALRNWGARRCWQKPGQTVDGIGFTLDEWSWPRWDAAATTGWLRVWPNPDLISAPARWTGTGWGAKMPLDPLVILGARLARRWRLRQRRHHRGPQRRDDHRRARAVGVVASAPDLRRAWWRANLTEWDWRADAISITRPGDQVRGSQGPWTKLDGLLTPEHLASDDPWPGPLRLVTANPQWGPGATAAPVRGWSTPAPSPSATWPRSPLGS